MLINIHPGNVSQCLAIHYRQNAVGCLISTLPHFKSYLNFSEDYFQVVIM